MSAPSVVYYGAVMLMVDPSKGDAIEIAYGPTMLDGSRCMLRVLTPEQWESVSAQNIGTVGKRRRVSEDEYLVAFFGGGSYRFHGSWIRAIESHYGPLLWGLSDKDLETADGRRGRFLAGYKSRARVAMIVQLL